MVAAGLLFVIASLGFGLASERGTSYTTHARLAIVAFGLCTVGVVMILTSL